MNKKILFCALFLVTGICRAEFSLNQLIELTNTGNATEAYEYANKYQARYEGNPRFDYHFAIAAIDAGFISHGVFALERVLLLQPANHSARLELARAYFLLEEYVRAREEFEAVQAVNPPESVQLKIQSYLSAIRLQEGRYRRTSSSFISFGFGTDSNVNSATDNQNPFIPALGSNLTDNQGFLSADSIEQDDNFTDFKIGHQINTPVTPDISMFADFSADFHMYTDLNQFDTNTYEMRFGFNKLANNDKYTASFLYQKFQLDGEDYRNLHSWNLDWRRRLSARAQLQAYTQLATFLYPDQEVRDSQLLTVGVGYLREFKGKTSPLLITNLYIGHEYAELDDPFLISGTERDLYGFSLGMQFTFNPKFSLTPTLFYQNSAYEEEDALLLDKREDEYTSLNIDFNWLINKRWSMQSYLTISSNDSNSELLQYDRDQLGANFRYAFD